MTTPPVRGTLIPYRHASATPAPVPASCRKHAFLSSRPREDRREEKPSRDRRRRPGVRGKASPPTTPRANHSHRTTYQHTDPDHGAKAHGELTCEVDYSVAEGHPQSLPHIADHRFRGNRTYEYDTRRGLAGGSLRPNGQGNLGSNRDDIINEFVSERMASYYLNHPDLTSATQAALDEARSLLPINPTASLVFSRSATEIVLRDVLMKPIASVWQKTPTPARNLRRTATLSARFRPRNRPHRHH